MAKKLIDILSDAAVVRDETNEKANTAERVGGVLVELANYLSNLAPVSNVTVESDGANVRLVLHLKNEDGTVSTRGVTLPGATTANAGVLTPELLKALNAADRSETAERQSADAELLKRIKGASDASSAYTDPFKYLRDYQSEKDASGTITKHATLVMQDALLETLRHSDYRDSFPYIGHMRAHVEGVPIEAWNYVKTWNQGSTNGVFVQVVRTNFGLKNGVISSALTESFHEYHRTVTVGMANGSVTDVTATAWKESNADIRAIADEGVSKADSALAKIAAEAKERAAADKANEDLAKEGISKAESASAMLFAEEAERKEADLSLNDLIEAEVTERLQSVATEAAARKAADAELQAKIAILVPSAMTVEAPKRITWGNVFPISIKAVLSPVTAMRNLIYLSDNKAVEVSTDGVLTPVEKGVSRVHVIPTLNTALARTCVIEVGDPRLRLSSLSALRFTQAGGFRLT